MANDGLARIYFVSFAVQTLLQGILFCTSFLFVYLMLRRRHQTRMALDMVSLAGVILITVGVSAHWSLSFAQLFNAIFPAGDQDATAYLVDLRNPLFIAKTYLFDVAVGLADLLFEGDSIFGNSLGARLVATMALAISLNTYCTVMIAWRIWKAGRCVARYGGPSLSESFIIFIESAGLYLLFVVITLVIYLSGSPVLFLCVDCNTAFAGLAYMFINVRVALGIAHQGVPTEPSGMNFASRPLTQQATILDLELGDTEVVSRFMKLPFFFRAHAAPEEGTQTDERTF
ncbi:hypothetical protein EV122DRAFT_277064 [Schizophyllum commune]